jgi:hypothetical protein
MEDAMANPILSQPPVSFRPEIQDQPIDLGQGFIITKINGGYEVLDGENIYEISKPNGKIVCDCPEFKLAPPGTCDHISELIERFGNGAQPNNNKNREPRTQDPQANPQKPTDTLPTVSKSQTALGLEHPFRDDQIKSKGGMPYIDGASVIQRLNDVLGTENWSFILLGEAERTRDEVLVRGRITATIGGKKVVKEDIGAHEHVRNRSGAILSKSDTVKAAVKDCIKRCAHQLGVGLHLYSPDGSYRSFRTVEQEEPN